MKPIFCPSCHRKVQIPEFLLKGNVKTEKGIKLQCGFCKPPKGIVRFYPPIKQQEENNEEQIEGTTE